MNEPQMPAWLPNPLLVGLFLLPLSVAGCERSAVEPPATAAIAGAGATTQIGVASAETVALTPLPPGNAEGTSTLRRRDQGFAVRVGAHGLQPGHAVTLWAMNLDEDLEPTGSVGRVAGGIVGGAGTVNLAGNNCLHETGKSPGTPPDCALNDPAAHIRFVLLQSEDPWEPGNQSSRWTPAGKPPAARADHLVAP